MNLFYHGEYKNYIYNSEKICKDLKGKSGHLPLDVDTEYQTHLLLKNFHKDSVCTNLTVQVKSVLTDEAVIFAHPDNELNARHPLFETEFIAFDYLNYLGYDVNYHIDNDNTGLPFLQVDLYGFFFIAELYRITNGRLFNRLDALIKNPSVHRKYGGIVQQRRVRTFTGNGWTLKNYIRLPWTVTINEYDYQLRLAIYDTGAIHGAASYQDFCKNSNVELEYKDVFTNPEKSNMLRMYSERPEDFDNYAKGDLFNYKALLGNRKTFESIYEILDIKEYYHDPALTIGSTVAKIFEGCLNKIFNAPTGNNKFINKFCKHGSAETLKGMSLTTAAYLIKCDGGRCRNNRPTDTVDKGVIIDIDINGCYGYGLRNQTYPVGRPLIIEYPLDSENNKYLTLKEFLKNYRNELIPGLWIARISLKDGYTLNYAQDMFISWLPPRDLKNMPTDSEMETTNDWWDVDNVGTIKIFKHEISHAILTHDLLQWIENIASRRQSKELLENLYVETAMFYPASQRVESIDDLIESEILHEGSNTTKINSKKDEYETKLKKLKIEEECYKWYGINMGDLMIDKLLIERAKHKKKTPMNEMLKLVINTTYGVQVSPFFKIGNVVVGNNITARARVLAWYMEKGLHLHQVITDGGIFNANYVVHPRQGRKINGENSVDMYADTNYNYTFKPLGNVEKIEYFKDGDESKQSNLYGLNIFTNNACISMDNSQSTKWLSERAWEHLQNLFPNVDILHKESTDLHHNKLKGQFNFEIKDIYDTAYFHGSANYSLGVNGKFIYKMRSYSKRNQIILDNSENLTIYRDDVNTARLFFENLTNINTVIRSTVFLRESILKINDYRHHSVKWDYTDVYPGCTIEKAGLIREFNLAQFTYNTINQYNSWKKEQEKLIKQFGQSYEQFFLNDDGTLDYQSMIEFIDRLIRENKNNFFDGIDKRQKNLYRKYLEHPAFKKLLHTKIAIEDRYFATGEEEDDIEEKTELNEYLPDEPEES